MLAPPPGSKWEAAGRGITFFTAVSPGSFYTLSPIVSRSLDFYGALPACGHFHEVLDPASYVPAPPDWDVVLSDVRGSTQAVEAGKYQDVNALGAATIIALRNALREVELPFVFGGDGATLLTPSEARATVASTLRGLRALAQSAFGLELRCGLVSLGELGAAGHSLRVAKFRASPHLTLAMFMGSALSEAELWVKSPLSGRDANLGDGETVAPDLEGFECRWQPFQSSRGVIVALLILALGSPEERQRTYRELLAHIEALADAGAPAPWAEEALRLRSFLSNFDTEAKLRSGQVDGGRFAARSRKARLEVAVGQLLLAVGGSLSTFDGRTYKAEVLQNCDFRKFDDMLRMVLDLSHTQHASLRQTLESYRDAGRICFGTHTSDSALLTCFVRSYAGDHLHFIDGSNGGYALAARELKLQLSRRSGA